eukprot:4081438-Pyramimonas_sp.AAC.1
MYYSAKRRATTPQHPTLWSTHNTTPVGLGYPYLNGLLTILGMGTIERVQTEFEEANNNPNLLSKDEKMSIIRTLGLAFWSFALCTGRYIYIMSLAYPTVSLAVKFRSLEALNACWLSARRGVSCLALKLALPPINCRERQPTATQLGDPNGHRPSLNRRDPHSCAADA